MINNYVKVRNQKNKNTMKTLKIFSMLVILLLVSQVGLSQKNVVYSLDPQGNATKNEMQTQNVTLHFDANVPELTDKQVSDLLKNGKIERSRKYVKGQYEEEILFYVPRVEVDSCFLSGNTVSYSGLLMIEQERMFSFWFLFFLLGIVLMIIVQILVKKNVVANLVTSVILVVFAVVCAVVFAAVYPFMGTLAVLVLSAVVVAAVVVSGLIFSKLINYDSDDDPKPPVELVNIVEPDDPADAIKKRKKFVNVYAYIYYACMLAACVFAYLQW